jgi:cellulose biosynthesis protein BcsQ
MAKRLVFFNHKGGVSKTTSAYNIGWMMAKNRRVLLVDADPQCNLTGLIIRDDFEKYYIDNETKKQNIKDGVAPAFDGKPVPIAAVECPSPSRSPKLFLVAGHANLSEYDAALTFAQTSNNAIVTLQNLPGAFAALLKLTEEKYQIDYTLIDLNPGLSAINQNLFLASDAFIIPTNPDPFSLMALDTLKKILPRWVTWKRDAVALFADSAYPLSDNIPKFLGSLVQRFNIRNGRAAKPYRDNISEINSSIADKLMPAFVASGMALKSEEYGTDLTQNRYCLSQIQDFHGLLPKSNDAGVPIYDVLDSEIKETGPILDGLKKKRQDFHEQFDKLSNDIIRMLAYA